MYFAALELTSTLLRQKMLATKCAHTIMNEYSGDSGDKDRIDEPGNRFCFLLRLNFFNERTLQELTKEDCRKEAGGA